MYKYNSLYIWVEGKYDKLFFETIAKPGLEKKYGRGRVHIRQYRQRKNQEIVNLIEEREAKDDICIGVADIDSASCISKRKQEKQREEFKSLDKNRITIVVKEIESWYLAGLDDKACRELEIAKFDTTDSITKNRFDHLWRRNRKFDSVIDFMQEILKAFDIETAKQKNKSFRYFVKKYRL